MVFRIRRWIVVLWTWITGSLSLKRLPAAIISGPQTQRTETLAESSFEGDAEMPHAMKWSDLPPELVEQILAKCSVVELARLATTCKTFRAVFCRQLRREQEARHDLALQCFGRERIMCIAAVVDRYLKGEPVHPDIGPNVVATCRISADGVLHNEGRGDHFFGPNGQFLTKDGDILIEIHNHAAYGMRLDVIEPSFAGRYDIHVLRGERTHIHLQPDGDVRSVALVQALLTGDLPETQADSPHPHSVLAPPYSNAAQPVTLDISTSTGPDSELTRPELLAFIAPLLPLVSQCKFMDTRAAFLLADSGLRDSYLRGMSVWKSLYFVD